MVDAEFARVGPCAYDMGLLLATMLLLYYHHKHVYTHGHPSSDLEKAEKSDLEKAENPDLEKAKNSDLEKTENPDLEKAENPDLEKAGNPDLEKAENPDFEKVGKLAPTEEEIRVLDLEEASDDMQELKNVVKGSDFKTDSDLQQRPVDLGGYDLDFHHKKSYNLHLQPADPTKNNILRNTTESTETESRNPDHKTILQIFDTSEEKHMGSQMARNVLRVCSAMRKLNIMRL
jgi:hypothetical protein